MKKFKIVGDTLYVKKFVRRLYLGDIIEYSKYHSKELKNVKKVCLPNSLIEIGTQAFSFFDSLEEIKMPNKLKIIREFAFSGCRNITHLEIPETVTTIEMGAFLGCEKLTEITLPQNIQTIEGITFSKCKSLKKIVFPSNLKVIENSAFEYCVGLIHVEIPNSVEMIGQEAFSHCKNMRSIKLSDSLSYINNYTFERCELLQNITVPDKVTGIGKGAFKECYSLKNIRLNDNISKIGKQAFFDCVTLEEIEIPNNVTEILSQTFAGCISLKKVKFPLSMQNFDDEELRRLEYISIKYSYKGNSDEFFSKSFTLKICDIPEFALDYSDKSQHFKNKIEYEKHIISKIVSFLNRPSRNTLCFLPFHIKVQLSVAFSKYDEYFTRFLEDNCHEAGLLAVLMSDFKIVDYLIQNNIFDSALIDESLEKLNDIKIQSGDTSYNEMYVYLMKYKEQSGNYKSVSEEIIDRFEL